METFAAPRPDRPRPALHDVALIEGDRSVSYGELDDRIGEVAAALGHTRRLVLVAAAPTVDAVVTYLAARRGGHPVLLAPGGDERVLAALADAYDPDVLAGPDGSVVAMRAGTEHDLHPALALLLSTSGSTGAPKLVRLSRRNVLSNAAAIADYLELRADDVAVTTLPLHYCYGLSVLHSHLHAGASVVLTELSVVDECFWDLAARTGVTGLAAVPHTFDLLDRAGFADRRLPALRRITQAGGRLDPGQVRRYARLGEAQGWELVVMYGQTEATARMAYLPPALAADRPTAIGIPIPGGSFRIDDPDGDGVGELVYSGPNVMLGYAESPADLALGATVEELRTGDLGRQADDGLYEVVGRRSRFVKPFGLRIDLDHLERLLADAGLQAWCDGDDRAVTVEAERTDPTLVHDLVRRHTGLPPGHVHVATVDELPRLPNGKPDRSSLRVVGGCGGHGPATAHNAAVGDVRTAIAAVLGRAPEDGESFVDAGGDSLSYVEVSVRLERLVGPLPAGWHTMPVEDLEALGTDGRRSAMATVDTGIVLRALAIVLVVGTHAAVWEVRGGAHALLAVAGYNFARFQLRAHGPLTRIARIALPSAIWIGGVVLVGGDFTWTHALLVNGFLGGADARWAYWFVEALVQILVVLALLFAVPAVVRWERRRPFGVAAAALAAGMLVRFDVVDLTTDHRITRPHEVFWLFALGWAAARATGVRRRVLVTLAATVAVAGFFDDPARELVVLGSVLLIGWLPAVRLPRTAVPALAALAAASLWIYLTHVQLLPLLRPIVGPGAATAMSLAVGVAAHRAAAAVRVGRMRTS